MLLDEQYSSHSDSCIRPCHTNCFVTKHAGKPKGGEGKNQVCNAFINQNTQRRAPTLSLRHPFPMDALNFWNHPFSNSDDEWEFRNRDMFLCWSIIWFVLWSKQYCLLLQNTYDALVTGPTKQRHLLTALQCRFLAWSQTLHQPHLPCDCSTSKNNAFIHAFKQGSEKKSNMIMPIGNTGLLQQERQWIHV